MERESEAAHTRRSKRLRVRAVRHVIHGSHVKEHELVVHTARAHVRDGDLEGRVGEAMLGERLLARREHILRFSRVAAR